MSQKRILSFFLALFVSILAFCQGTTSRAYWTYIDKYRDICLEQMQKYHIPASVTMAQALLESAAGRSTLVTEAHNHFGIKTPGDWKGPYVVRDDDRKGEHFRKYKTDAESFEDHSKFLLKKRYAVLFTYKITDYKAWCRGLKACGYATSPTYAENLIHIIEQYSLHQLDGMKPGQKNLVTTYAETKSPDKGFFDTHMVYMNNKNYFIIVEAGDNLKTIAHEAGVSLHRLRKYNDLPRKYILKAGDIIYLKRKRKRAAKEFAGIPHIVVAGQSLYDISQLYGVRLKSLYKLNALPKDYVAKVGDKVWVY